MINAACIYKEENGWVFDMDMGQDTVRDMGQDSDHAMDIVMHHVTVMVILVLEVLSKAFLADLLVQLLAVHYFGENFPLGILSYPLFR